MVSRRQLIQAILALYGSTLIPNRANSAQTILKKKIPSSGEHIPAVGMGTWITFDVNSEKSDVSQYIAILEKFFQSGGTMIDSSPMYGYAQKLLGDIMSKVQSHEQLFSATKVWTMGESSGITQMNRSAELWDLNNFDLMYVHNMLDWKTHLMTLNQWKNEGKLKYTGITTSHGRRHQDLIDMLKKNPVDFVQFTYNIHDRKAEQYILPLAQELGVAVVINRPFQTGGLFSRVRGKALPDWASEIGCKTWSQFFLKFIISHPAVTCAIPATSQVTHMAENMQALNGELPDEKVRQEMIKYFNHSV